MKHSANLLNFETQKLKITNIAVTFEHISAQFYKAPNGNIIYLVLFTLECNIYRCMILPYVHLTLIQ